MYKNYEYKISSNIQQKNIPIEYCTKFTIINTQKFEILKILIYYILYVSHSWNYFKNMTSNNIQKFVLYYCSLIHFNEYIEVIENTNSVASQI